MINININKRLVIVLFSPRNVDSHNNTKKNTNNQLKKNKKNDIHLYTFFKKVSCYFYLQSDILKSICLCWGRCGGDLVGLILGPACLRRFLPGPPVSSSVRDMHDELIGDFTLSVGVCVWLSVCSPSSVTL